MKAKLILSTIFLVAGISLYAQDSTKLTKVFLQDGTTCNAYVEKQADGGYKLTTEDGSVLFFREGEISLGKPFKKSASNAQAKTSVQRQDNIQPAEHRQAQSVPVKNYKYRDLKKMYSARDYYGHEAGDKYSPVAIGIASFILPGFGQYLTGSQIGWGILQSALVGMAIPFVFTNHWEERYVYNYNISTGQIYNYHQYYYEWWAIEIAIPAICVWAGTAIWSACSASKAAKIKNLYYRDVRNGVAYKFDVIPYFNVTAPVLASNQNFVTGLSLRVSF